MQIFDKIIDFFSGKKTYIIGILMIILGLLVNEKQLILEGIGFITLRAAMKKLWYGNRNSGRSTQ